MAITDIENGIEEIEDALDDAISTALIFELESEHKMYEKAKAVCLAIRQAVPDDLNHKVERLLAAENMLGHEIDPIERGAIVLSKICKKKATK